jgi:hypothetical protein
MISEENKKNWQEYAQSLFDEVWVDYGFLKDKKMKPLDEEQKKRLIAIVEPEKREQFIERCKSKGLIETQTIIDRIMVQVTEHNMRSLSKPKILVLSTPAYKELGEYMKIHLSTPAYKELGNITVDARGYFVVYYCLGMDVAELVKPTNEIEIHVF